MCALDRMCVLCCVSAPVWVLLCNRPQMRIHVCSHVSSFDRQTSECSHTQLNNYA